MSDIKWMDGAVCCESCTTFVAAGMGVNQLYCETPRGDVLFTIDEVLEFDGLRLNNLRIGDYISKSELDTEDKYNKAVEVFELFGFERCGSYSSFGCECHDSLVVNIKGFVVSNNFDSTLLVRRLAFNQLMAIGELKRLMNERESDTQSKGITPSSVIDQVKSPSHYQLMDDVESIEIIARSLTHEQWKGFCLGNMLKYRIRAGKKDDLQQDIDKADFYGELYEMHKGKCYE